MVNATLQSVLVSDRYEAKQILREAYRTDAAVHDYLAQARQEPAQQPSERRPLSTIAYFPAEGVSWHGYKALALRYALCKVYSHTGISFEDLIDKPRGFIEAIFEACEETNKLLAPPPLPPP